MHIVTAENQDLLEELFNKISQGKQTVLAVTADLDLEFEVVFFFKEMSQFSSDPNKVWNEDVHLTLSVTTHKICMNLQNNHLHSIFLQ